MNNNNYYYSFTAIMQVNLQKPAPPVKTAGDFVGAKFYCQHAVAGGIILKYLNYTQLN